MPYDGRRFGLVEQFRYPIGERRWEFPQGTAPELADADPVELARRELREETGLRATTFEPLGRLDVAPGMSSQRGWVFLATGIVEGEADREHIAAYGLFLLRPESTGAPVTDQGQ
jgi:ADP-ribose pyrophosphatase